MSVFPDDKVMIIFRLTDGWFSESCFPSYRKCCSERPGAVKGAPAGAALRTLEGEDRSEKIEEEGKQIWTPGRFLKREQAKRIALCQPWFYLRLVAYSFFRLSEGA